MISWLADRRLARKERDTELRLRRLILHVAATSTDFYVPSAWVDVLGSLRVNTILAEYGIPPARPERWPSEARSEVERR